MEIALCGHRCTMWCCILLMYEPPVAYWLYILATNHIPDRVKCHSDSVKTMTRIRFTIRAHSKWDQIDQSKRRFNFLFIVKPTCDDNLLITQSSYYLVHCLEVTPREMEQCLLCFLVQRWRSSRNSEVVHLSRQLHAIVDYKSLFVCVLLLA